MQAPAGLSLSSYSTLPAAAAAAPYTSSASTPHAPRTRGSHSSTFRLNLRAFCGIGVHLGVTWGVLKRCQRVSDGTWVIFCVRNGSG